MSIVVCGSLAFNTIMEVNKKFHFNDSSAHLNAYFSIPDMRRGFSGCAGNISYTLKLLDCQPLPVATVGSDFHTYNKWLKQCKIKRDYIKTIKHSYTAQSFVTKDMADNRITTYHTGAMAFSDSNSLLDLNLTANLAVIAPESETGMLQHARELNQYNIPFLFYPKQTLERFEEGQLLELIEIANWMIVTENQLQTLQNQLGLDAEKLKQYLDALIIQESNQTCLIYADNICHQIPAARFKKKNDFTGCKDAFCAGILYSLEHDIDWETGGRIANLMTGIVAEYHGAQTHHFNLTQFKQLFRKVFDYRLM